MTASAIQPAAAIQVRALKKNFGDRAAVDGVDITVLTGEILGILGPNGGGKTTLFRMISTLIPPDSGSIEIAGTDISLDPRTARHALGVVFQAPSLDGKLTVRENLVHQGRLYGMGGTGLDGAVTRELERAAVADRAKDRVETLSGGLKRRVEIAKALLHEPDILLLDEPSTGLDPAARARLWEELTALRDTRGLTVLLTTHFIDEAERCDRVAIMDHGILLALDTPTALRRAVGGDVLTITSTQPDHVAELLRSRHGLEARVVAGRVRVEHENAAGLVEKLSETCGAAASSFTVGKPTMEDAFIRTAGHGLDSTEEPA